ncbi:MAG: alkaline phosphatase family protein [Actinobacteria bacterium]|nr:alkaline phosphatase family protein [Actinomycetota bacterium]
MKPKILLVGIDGLVLSTALDSGQAPYLQSLKKRGYFTEFTMDVPTLSGPGWSTLLTGSTHAEHKVGDNSFIGHNLLRRPDLLSRAFYQDQSTTTFAAAGWPPLVDPAGPGPVIHQRREQQLSFQHRVIVRDGETHGYRQIDAEIADVAIYAISQHGPDVSFIYFCGADEAGHTHGTLGQEYLHAIARIDDHLHRLESALLTRTQNYKEEWLLVLTTDHGHLDEGGHGGDSDQEKASFLIAVGIGRGNPDWNERMEPHDLVPLLLDERA